MDVTPATPRAVARRDPRRGVGCCALVLTLLAVLWPRDAQSQAGPCSTDSERIAEALGQIQRAVDPCGESAQLHELLQQLERCSESGYRICTSTDTARNVFDPPRHVAGELPLGTITWNPDLRSDFEEACDGDPTVAVTRDPTASLLHELAHAAQECAGLNPGEHELEAVRLENIYRRAAGLCQRGAYGDLLLPASMVRTCNRRSCSCSMPVEVPSLAGVAGTGWFDPSASKDGAGQRSGDRPE